MSIVHKELFTCISISLMKRHKGFTLIEALVAVVVLSIGLLGLASLQILSNRSNFEAIQMTQATLVVNDIINRMRANSTKLDEYAATDLGGNSISPEPISSCTANEATSTCLSKIVNHDRWEWEQTIDDSDTLVTPKICISNNASNVKVVVAWLGHMETTIPATDLDDCGKAEIENSFLKQLIVNTYITPINPMINP